MIIVAGGRRALEPDRRASEFTNEQRDRQGTS
jgi:hypothetical protein